MEDLNRFLNQKIGASARCQRNYDLSKDISPEDERTLMKAIKEAPSKQNAKFFRAIVVKDQATIKKLYEATSFTTAYDGMKAAMHGEEWLAKKQTNPQILGKMCVVFVRDRDIDERKNADMKTRNLIRQVDDEAKKEELLTKLKADQKKLVQVDIKNEDRAVGVAAGYLSLVTEMLGMKSGCCQCKHDAEIMDILGLESDSYGMNQPLLMMGIGYGDESRDRREHMLHDDVKFPTFSKKVDIEVI